MMTQYAGMLLTSPIIVSSSGLTSRPERNLEFEKAGAGAIVLKSLFEEQIEIVNKTLADIGAAGKPSILVFNKIDAYTYVKKDEDDLTPRTKENITLAELMQTWMAKLEANCIFISAREKTNIEELKELVYKRVKELHVQKYPYNDFLYQLYEEDTALPSDDAVAALPPGTD